jgi:hypothetical protein
MTRFAAPRAALLPAFRDSSPADLDRALAEGGPELEALIRKEQLAPLWHARISAPAFAANRVNAAMVYLRQVAAQREIDRVLTDANIEYAVFKGAAIRERIYEDPSVRLCCDIDILVPPAQRTNAARALVDAGYTLRVDPSLASHEVVLNKDFVAIDLHWSLLRPGRTPESMAVEMLARRQRSGERWMLGETDTLFVLLVHPAFSKHLSIAQMGLHRIGDIVSWLQKSDVDWPALHHQLDACGLKTAAWTMVNLVGMLSPPGFVDALETPLRLLRPDAVRAAYLRTWLNQDLSSRFANLHLARLLGFSVLLHDQPAGAWRALRGWRRSRVTQAQDAEVFAGLSQPDQGMRSV